MHFDPVEDPTLAPPESHYVMLFQGTPPDAAQKALEDLHSETDRFYFSDAEVHWLIACKISESPLFGREMDRATKGLRMTVRNVTTLRRILAKMASEFPG